MKKIWKVLVAFLAGEAVQIVLQLVAEVNFMRHPVLFCGAAGFLVFVAVFSGARLGVRDGANIRTYRDYAEGE